MPLGEDQEPIVLFNGGQLGYGWAERPTRDAQVYHWTYGFDCRVPGRAYPSLAPLTIGVDTDATISFSTMFEWEEADGRPLLLFGGGITTARSVISRLRDGTVAGEDTRSQDAITSGVLYRHDGSDPDVEMAYFCNGTANDALIQRNKAGTYAVTGHTFKCDVLAVVGSDLWAAQGYKALKLTVNSDPGLSGSWGTGIPVGLPSYDINEIVALGTEPVVLKGDGVFVYDVATNEFQNLTKTLAPHSDNGKGGFSDGRGRVYYPTVDGDIIVLSIGFQDQQKPVKTTIIDRDTPWGRVTAMTADMEHVYAVTEPGQISTRAAGVGLVVMTFNDTGDAYTTHTSDLTDGQFGTELDLTGMFGADADYIYVGADEPFMGVYFKVTTGRTAVLTARFVATYSTAASWAGSSSHDGTVGFINDGLITVQTTELVDLKETATNPWAQQSVNGVSKYWMRFTSGDAGSLYTTATIAEVSIVPYRPPLHKDAPNAVFPVSAYAMAHALPKVLVGTWVGEEIIWQDVWTLDACRVERLVVGRGYCGAVQGRRALYALTQESMYVIPVGPDVHPSRASWPKLSDYGEFGTADGTHIIALSPTTCWLGNNEWKVVGDGIFIHAPHTQDDDEWWVHYAWDEGEVQTLGPFPDEVIQTGALVGQGRVLSVWLAFKDGSRDAIAPYLRWAEVPAECWEDLGPIYQAAAEDISSPQFR